MSLDATVWWASIAVLGAGALAPAPARAQLLGAAASHAERDGAVVVWSADTLYVSRDDGAHFAARPMPVAGGRDVVVERGGALLVLGGTDAQSELVRVHPDGHVEAIPTLGWVATIASGGDVVVALVPGAASVAFSTRGGPFVVRALPPTFDRRACGGDDPSTDAALVAECMAQRTLAPGASLAVDRGGTAHVIDVEVNTCGSSDLVEWARTLTVRGSGAASVARLPTGGDVFPSHWTAAIRGWSFAVGPDGRFAALASGRTQVLDGPIGAAFGGGLPAFLETNGALTVAQLESHLVLLDGARAEPLADLPPRAALADVDARGRVLAVGPTGLLRWSRRSGWTVLLSGS